jgi:hypothetical protein
MQLTHRGTVGALLLAVALTACGGGASQDDRDQDTGEPSSPTSSVPGGDPPAGAGDPVAGAYRLTSTITKSDIPGNKPGPKSRLESQMFLTCADEDCSALFQRAAADNWHAGTVRLAATKDGLTGAHTRSGPCTSGGGSYTEAFEWRWETGDELTGTAVQTFTGCDLDGSATYRIRAARDESSPVPYLAAEESRTVAAALTEYDATVRWVYERYNQCRPGAATGKPEIACKSAVYDRWAPTVAPLSEGLEPVAVVAKGVCAEVLDELRLDRLDDALGGARSAFAAGAQGRDLAAVDEAAVKLATEQHELLVAAALMCVAPADHALLGDSGALAMDINSWVSPT